jgi:hypothetical protein
MALHKALFEDIPPAAVLLKRYRPFVKSARQADGYYHLVQAIARRYGARAYRLAERVFKETGMQYNPAALRAPGTIRRVGYAFDGINIYDVDVRPYVRGREADLVWLHNREVRLWSRRALVDRSSLAQKILTPARRNHDGIFIAYNKNGQRLGFIHCAVDKTNRTGSVEALFFLTGEIHQHVAQRLVVQARKFFKQQRVIKILAMPGWRAYPCHRVLRGAVLRTVKKQSPHISLVLRELVRPQHS